jgi:hypothetical protein
VPHYPSDVSLRDARVNERRVNERGSTKEGQAFPHPKKVRNKRSERGLSHTQRGSGREGQADRQKEGQTERGSGLSSKEGHVERGHRKRSSKEGHRKRVRPFVERGSGLSSRHFLVRVAPPEERWWGLVAPCTAARHSFRSFSYDPARAGARRRRRHAVVSSGGISRSLRRWGRLLAA